MLRRRRGRARPAGSYVVKPRGVPHAFYNAGTETVRVMEILTPGRSFEGYFDEYEEIVGSRDERRGAQEGAGRARRALRDNLARRTASPR